MPCYFQGMDYQQPGCSYPAMVGLWDNRTDSNNAGWFTGLRGDMPDLIHPYQCQLLCQNVTGCDFWSFEIETSAPEARCFLKAAYADPNCGYSKLAAFAPPRQTPGSPWTGMRAGVGVRVVIVVMRWG
jgi:hypothetical protein